MLLNYSKIARPSIVLRYINWFWLTRLRCLWKPGEVCRATPVQWRRKQAGGRSSGGRLYIFWSKVDMSGWLFFLVPVLGLTVNTFPISWGWSSPGDHLGRVHLHGGWVDQQWRSKAIKSNLLPLWFIVLCVHHNGDECESSGIVEFPQTGKSPTTIWVETNFLPSVLLGWTGFRTPPAFPSAGGSRNVDFFFPFSILSLWIFWILVLDQGGRLSMAVRGNPHSKVSNCHDCQDHRITKYHQIQTCRQAGGWIEIAPSPVYNSNGDFLVVLPSRFSCCSSKQGWINWGYVATA